MKTIHAVWELENIGADAWEIWLDAADTTEMLAQEEERIIAQGAEYIVVKTPPNCKQLIFGIPQMGYTFVEQVFHVAVRRDEYNMPETIARFDRGLTVVEYTQKEDLERISITVETLQLWAEKMLANGVIDAEAYNARKNK